MTTTQQQAGSHLGGTVFPVAQLNEFPSSAFSLSFWARQSVQLQYGSHGTGFHFSDTVSYVSINIQENYISLEFSGGMAEFRGTLIPLFSEGKAHHYTLTFSATDHGYLVACYVNAVLVELQDVRVDNGNAQPMYVIDRGPLYIGNFAPNESLDGPYNGMVEARGALSELHIYNGVLDANAVNQDALGMSPNGVNSYLNMPFDEIHYDRKNGLWQDIVSPAFSAKDIIRTDDNPTVVSKRNYNRFPTDSRTVAFWIRCRADASGTLISYADVSNSSHPNDGGVAWQLQNPRNLTLNSYSSGANVGTGFWNHVVVIEDSIAKTTTIYVNGVPAPESPASYVVDGVITNQPLVIGANKASDDESSIFTGDLTALRIWSRTLNIEEVSALARGEQLDSHHTSLTDYVPLGFSGVTETEIQSNLHPSVTGDREYPLLSKFGVPQAMQIGPDAGGMHVSPYTGLTGAAFSIELWTRLTSDGFVFRGIEANTQVSIALRKASTSLIVELHDSSNNAFHDHTMPTDNIALHEWHHICVTTSSASVIGYINGQQVFSDPITAAEDAPLLGAELHLQLGNFDAQTVAAAGQLTEVRFWQKTLSPGEIRHRMNHYLDGSDANLLGRWGFENSLGRDTSGRQNHAFPAGTPEFSDIEDLDIEPIDTPYLVAQVCLLEDYQFDHGETGTITPRNSYRVNVTAYDQNDRPLSNAQLSISVQAEPGNTYTQTSLYTEDSGITDAHEIAIGQPYIVSTNALGTASFSIPADDIMAPVLRVVAPFMENGHALLVFPDRQAHHQLSAVTDQMLLSKPVMMEPNGSPRPIVTEVNKESAKHVANAIRHFIGSATEKTPQSRTPVVRLPNQRLLKEVFDVPARRYENPTASPEAYHPQTDVISGHAMNDQQSLISRSMVANDMPDWKFVDNGNGNVVVEDLSQGNRSRGIPLPSNAEIHQDDFSKLVFTAKNGRQRSGVPLTHQNFLDAMDSQHRQRGFFSSLFNAIKNAINFVVTTVEHAVVAAVEAVKVVVIYVAETVEKVTAFAIHSVEHAVEAVKGVLDKVGATVLGAINFVKALFDWSDILETHDFIRALLQSSLKTGQARLAHTKKASLEWVDKKSEDVQGWLEALKSDNQEHQSAMVDSGPSGQRQNVKSGYIQHMVGSHVGNATIEGELGNTGTADSQTKLDNITNNNQQSINTVTSHLESASLFNNGEFSLKAVMNKLVDLLEAIASGVFSLMKAGIDWFFTQLDILLTHLDALLSTRINIPLVTHLYEKYITVDSDHPMGSTLTIYDLAALLGAIPTTVIYKLVTGSEHGPYHQEQLAQYRELATVLPTVAPPGQVLTPEQQASEERRQKASIGLGGTFLAFTAIAGITNTIMASRAATVAPSPLQKVNFAINGIFQLTQFPLGTTFTLDDAAHSTPDNNDNPAPISIASASLEETIWAAQFFPIYIEGRGLAGKSGLLDTIGMPIFGGVHAALFISVFATEMVDSNADHTDSGIKFVGNLSSCVPEIASAIPDAQFVVRTVIDGVAFTLWESINLIRYSREVGAHQVFLVR